MESAYLETNITLEFKYGRLPFWSDKLLQSQRPAGRDSLLCRSIQRRRLHFTGSHWSQHHVEVSLSPIVRDFFRFRQDCGEGTIEDLYRGPFGVGVWHNVTIVRQ